MTGGDDWDLLEWLKSYPKERVSPEVRRRLVAYEELQEFVEHYEWASADGGEYVLGQVRFILDRGKEAA